MCCCTTHSSFETGCLPSCMTYPSITWVKTCGLTNALGKPRSLDASSTGGTATSVGPVSATVVIPSTCAEPV